jgi:chromosome partitioning protein
MAYRVCITNQKGGTGKTTIAVNLAGALAAREREVLLIDLDPQGYATEATGLADAYDGEPPTLHDVLLDNRAEGLTELIHTGNEFDVIPSNSDLVARNTESQLKQATAGEQRLSRALDALEEETDYDVILIDCPPGLGALTDNALLATQHVVIPAETKTTSMRALELLSDQMDSLERFFEVDIQPIALVANEVRQDGVSDKMLEWFDQVFQDSVPTFEVRKRVALQRAMENGRSIITHDEESDMEAVFDDLAAHVEQEATG